MASSTKVEVFAGQVPVLNRAMAVLRISAEPEQPQFRHNVLLLDCSGSMDGSLGSLKKDAREFVAEGEETDYVSIVVFSGHGFARLVCGPVRCDAAGKTILDQSISGIRILNTTVFSEPLELTLDKLKREQIEGMASQAILFTDGCAVPTHWDVPTEEQRAFAAAKALYEFGAAVSVIGYGFHYDERFINRLMAAGGYSGVFRHMNDIEDFTEVIRDIRDTFARTDLTDLTIHVQPSASEQVAAVFRTLPEVLQVSTNGLIRARGLFDGSLTFYMNLEESFDKVNVRGVINGEEFELMASALPLTPELEAECVRVIAAQAAICGDTAYAIELLQQTGDDGVAETIGEAYTQREQRTNADRLRRAFRDKRFIGAGLKPTGPSHCVINVLRVLMEDPSVVLSVPANGYARGGVLKEDPRVVHSPLGKTLEVISYTSKKDRWNFSLTTKKAVRVLPADDDGNIIENGQPVESTVHRTYNIVRDGELVMKQILASMAAASFNELQEAGVIDASATYKPGQSYSLTLDGMKMVSSAWARPSSLGLVRLLCEEAELMAEQKALNARIKDLGKPEAPEFDEHGVYHEKPQVDEYACVEYYDADCMELRLMGYKPEFDSRAVESLSFEESDARVKKVRQRLRAVRFIARSIAFACELTGWQSVDWGTPKVTQRGQDPKSEYNAQLGGQTVKRVTWETAVPWS